MATTDIALKKSLAWAGAYLLIVSGLLVVGIEFDHRFSTETVYLYWFFLGILVLPWSIISFGLFMASLHAGGFEIAQFSLALGAILNSFAIYFLSKRFFLARYDSVTT